MPDSAVPTASTSGTPSRSESSAEGICRLAIVPE